MGLFGSRPPLDQLLVLLLLLLLLGVCSGYGMIRITASTTTDNEKTSGNGDHNIPLNYNPSGNGNGATQCSFFTKCGAGETCCCTNSLPLSVCIKWRCCAIDSAVCCKDNSFCCPKDYPVCDNEKKQCFKKKAVQGALNATMLKGISTIEGRSGSSPKFGGWRSLMQGAWNM